MAEMAEETRARKRGMRAVIVLMLVAAVFAVLIFVGYNSNEFKRSTSGDNTQSPLSVNENR
jgi:hypothetical protein